MSAEFPSIVTHGASPWLKPGAAPNIELITSAGITPAVWPITSAESSPRLVEIGRSCNVSHSTILRL